MLFAAFALLAAGQTFSCRVAAVHDGDTMRCADGTRIRLQAIDANEMDGSCHHACARMPALAARDYLGGLALGKDAQCQVTGTSYRRVTAWCAVAGKDLSCAMVQVEGATVWTRFDPEGRLLACQLRAAPYPPMIIRRSHARHEG